MNKRIHPVFFLIFVALGAAVSADPLELTVDKAVDLAVKNNLTLKGEALQLEAKKRSKDYSWNAFVPKTSVGAALSHLNEGPKNPYAPLAQLPPLAPYASGLTAAPDNIWHASTSLNAQLNISLALFDGIRHTVLDYEGGVIQADAAKQKLIRDTKKAFYNLLLLQANYATFSDQVENARKHYEKEKRNFESGVGSEFSMLNTQVAWENLKPGLDEMKIAVDVAELAFKQTLGLNQNTDLHVVGSFDHSAVPLDNDQLVNQAINNNPNLASIRQNIRIQKNLRQGQFNLDYLPVLGFSFAADPTFQKDPFKDPLFNNISNDWKQSGGLFSIYLSQPLDGFLPFSSTAITLANMDTGIAQVENGLLQAIQGTQLQVTSLVMQVEKSRRSIDRLELNVDLANRAYQMAERGYETGAYELLQVQDADAKLRESKLNVLAEKYAYLSGLFDLEFETNQSLTVK